MGAPSNLQRGNGNFPAMQVLHVDGYSDVRAVGREVCAIKQFNYTTALVVGLDPIGYARRYCYEHAADARAALQAWDGTNHPSGPWIKCKGAGIDLFNPDWK
jgi:hypothetical protein